MKIEIDTDELLGEPEALQQLVINRVAEDVRKGITKQITEETSRLIQASIKAVVDEQMPTLLPSLLDTKYAVVTNWGEKKRMTTVRDELLKQLRDHLLMKADYNGKTQLNATVSEMVREAMNGFKAEFKQQFTESMQKEAIAYAVTAIKESFKL